MKKFILLGFMALFTAIFAIGQNYDYEGKRISIKRRNTDGKIELIPGSSSDIEFNDEGIIRYNPTTNAFTLVGTGVHLLGTQAVGQLYRVADSVYTLAADSTYYDIEGLTTASNNVNTTLSDSSIAVSIPGYYTVSVSANLTHASDTTIINIGVFVNDTVEQTHVIAKTEVRTKTKYETISSSGLLYLAAGDKVGIKAKANKTGALTISGINFYLKRE